MVRQKIFVIPQSFSSSFSLYALPGLCFGERSQPAASYSDLAAAPSSKLDSNGRHTCSKLTIVTW